MKNGLSAYTNFKKGIERQRKLSNPFLDMIENLKARQGGINGSILAQYQSSAASALFDQMKLQTSPFQNAIEGLNEVSKRHDLIIKGVLSQYTGGYIEMMANAVSADSNISHIVKGMNRVNSSWPNQLGVLGATVNLGKFIESHRTKMSPIAEAAIAAGSNLTIRDSRIGSLVSRLSELRDGMVPSHLKHLLGNVSRSLATEIVSQEEYEPTQIIENIAETSAGILEEEYVTPAHIQQLTDLLEEIKTLVLKLHPNIRMKFLTFISTIILILTAKDYSQKYFGSKESQTITYGEFQELRNEIHEVLDQAHKQAGNSLTLKRDFLIKTKPNRNAGIIECLSAGSIVFKMDSIHKWVYIGYKSPADSLPQHGWVLKKYLSKSR